MIIDESVGKIINTKDVYIHDDILRSLEFDRMNRKILLKFSSSCDKHNDYLMEFLNVVGFEMTACNFWGVSESVLDFEYIEKDSRVLLPKLSNMWSKVPCSSQDVSYDNYIETMFTFSSGDVFIVASEKIIILR